MQNVRNRWARPLFLAIWAFVFLFALVFPGWERWQIKRDRATAVVHTATAPVAILVPKSQDATGTPVPAQVSVRLFGGIYPVENVQNADHLRIGGLAEVVYREGRSGHIYVDSAEPVPDSSRP